MANVGTVTFDIAAEAAKLRTELDKVKKDVRGLKDTGSEMGSSLTSGFGAAQKAMAAFGVTLGGAAVVGAMVRGARAAIEYGDAIGKAASKSGIAAADFQALAYAAKMSDVEMGSLSTSLRVMQTNISEAASGSKSATAALNGVGLSVAQLRGMQPEQQFQAIAEQISRIKDPADRARAATELFGRAGADLLPMFEQGASGIRKATDEARRLGLILSNEQLQALQTADDAIKRLDTSFSNLARTLTARVAPALSRFFESVAAAINGDEIRQLEISLDDINAKLNTPGTSEGARVQLLAEFVHLSEKLAKLRKEAGFGAGASAAAGEMLLPNPNIMREFWEGSAWLDEASKGKKAGDSAAMTQFLNRSGGSGMGAPGSGRMVMRNGQLVPEDQAQTDAMGALGDEIALQAMRDLNAKKLEIDDEYNRQVVERAQLREFSLMDIIRGSEETQTMYRQAAAMSWASILDTALSGALAGNKKLAKANQAIALAQAIWNTATGVTKALSVYDYVGAAKIAAMGALQIAKIRSTKYSESATSGSAASAGGGFDSSNPAVDRQAQGEVQARPVAQLVINGNVFGTQETEDWVIGRLQDAIENRDVTLFTTRSRQAQDLVGVPG